MMQKNVFEQERLLSENIMLQRELDSLKRNYKLEVESERYKVQERVKDMDEIIRKKDGEKENLDRELKNLELRIDEFAGVDSLMEAIRYILLNKTKVS